MYDVCFFERAKTESFAYEGVTMKICVFCSAQDVPENYKKAAHALGTLLGKNGHDLVWGGTDRGLMHEVAAGVREGGGKLIAVSTELVKHKIHKSPDEAVITKSLGERKAVMLERADVLIALVGGIGTLDEITEVIELRRHSTHDKLVIVLDTDGFYDGFQAQLQRMDAEGFFLDMDKREVEGLENLVFFAKAPEEAVRYIEEHAS